MWLLSSFPRAYLRCFFLPCLLSVFIFLFVLSLRSTLMTPVSPLFCCLFLSSHHSPSILSPCSLSFMCSISPFLRSPLLSTPPRVLSSSLLSHCNSFFFFCLTHLLTHFCFTFFPSSPLLFSNHFLSSPLLSSPLSHHVPSSAHFSILFPLYLTPLLIFLWSVALLSSVCWSLTFIKLP